MADNYEKLIRWYLRLNGYFTIENFITHAAGDPNCIRDGLVGNFTETDIIGVRMPYSSEITGNLHIANHQSLVNVAAGKFDVIIAEVKSGSETRPNRSWRENGNLPAIEYIVRFIGLCKNQGEIERLAQSLMERYFTEEEAFQIRYILFSREVNDHWNSRGVCYITFDEILNFLIEVRGQCWINAGIGVASLHSQWEAFINEIFQVANNQDLSISQRRTEIYHLLDRPD